MKFEPIYTVFTHENAFEYDVCEMAAILFRGGGGHTRVYALYTHIPRAHDWVYNTFNINP